MSKLSREKGKRGEREVAALLEGFGWAAKRGVQYQGGHDSPDVVHSMEGFHIEVKRAEGLNIGAALKQMDEDKKPGETGLIFYRRNGWPDYVIIARAKELLKDLKELYPS